METDNTIDEPELIRLISERTGLQNEVAELAISLLSRIVLEEIGQGKVITLVGIGAFSFDLYELMKSGKPAGAIIEANEQVYFRPSPTLRDEGGPRSGWHRRPVATVRAPRKFGPMPPREDLVMRLATEANLNGADARYALDSVVEALRDTLLADREVRFGRLGILSRSPKDPYADLRKMEIERRGFLPLIEEAKKNFVSVEMESSVPVKEERFEVVEIFFGTDRERHPRAKSPAKRFGAGRGNQLSYGVCEVSIPHNHRIGKLESPFMLRYFLQNPAKHVVLMRVDEYSASEFGQAISEHPHKGEKRRALIFIHGFNTSFEDAARRAAQIAYDIEFSGVPFVYSWPSGDKVLDYIRDGNDADQAAIYFQEFVLTVMRNGKFDEVVVLAHSMGNRVLGETIKLMMSGHRKELERMTEVVFAAPDIDADVFRTQIVPPLAKLGIATTLYASSNDKALAASKKANGAPRAGDAGQALLVLAGVETVDASAIETSLFGLNHSYIGSAVRLTADLHHLIEMRARAAYRYGLAAMSNPIGHYWCFRP
ncbi:alpha/beta hydrolase [Paraburkholderia sp. J63]|uniref:alpha/beta hydrolase n=1 Tax=Paraburkholderia sp. J63 TaxID=2805434 RepID=UPI002ABE86DB|nr:alpha/beta hydrolase [Paraburkholderia sp. J63]